jgi:hypothetical protein
MKKTGTREETEDDIAEKLGPRSYLLLLMKRK